MALTFVDQESHPMYTALSTDIVAGKITGANIKGGTIYLTDTDDWRIIENDLTLGEYVTSGSKLVKYSKLSSHSHHFNVQKGNLNKLRIRPQVLNEHVESSREALSTVTTAVDCGQFFRVPKDNINGISLTLASAEANTSMDARVTGAGEKKAGTFEYSADAALQAEYIKSGAVEMVRSAFTGTGAVTQDGSFAGKIPTAIVADSFTVSLTSTNLTGVTFSLKFAQTFNFNKIKVYFFIGDGTNTKSFPLAVNAANVWNTFSFSETDMSVTANDSTATTATMTAITKMGFRVDDAHSASFGYVDSITYQALPGSVQLELWDFGGSSLPLGDGSVDYTAAGTQYATLGDLGIQGFVTSSITLPLLGGKRKYMIDDFIAGAAKEMTLNAGLVSGNYMAIVIKHVDTDVTVYGADTAQSYSYYDSGYAWKAEVADNLIDAIAGAVGAGLYADFMFQIFSTQDVYVTKTAIFAEASPDDNANFSVYLEDSSMGIVDIPIVDATGHEFLSTTFTIDMSDRPSFLEDGGKVEVYYNDIASDTTLTNMVLAISYLYVPPTIYG